MLPPTPSTLPTSAFAANTLYIPGEIWRQIGRHLSSAYPHEACGVLLAKKTPWPQPTGAIVIADQFDLPNSESEHRRHNHYTIAPAAMFAAQRQANFAGLDIAGIYHSHPNAPPLPSAADTAAAWPVYIYLIAQVQQTGIAQARAWRLSTAEAAAFEELGISIGSIGDPA